MDQAELRTTFLKTTQLAARKGGQIKTRENVRVSLEPYRGDSETITADYLVSYNTRSIGAATQKIDTYIFISTFPSLDGDKYYQNVEVIKSFDDIVNAITKIRDENYDLQKYCSDHYVWMLKVIDYANNFFHELASSVAFSGAPINPDCLPLSFYDYYADVTILNIAGNANISKNQACVRIPIKSSTSFTSILKKTIRHEIMHYFLAVSGQPATDDALEFWCLCFIFDGGAYKALSEADQIVYDIFVDEYSKDCQEDISSYWKNLAFFSVLQQRHEVDIETFRMLFKNEMAACVNDLAAQRQATEELMKQFAMEGSI